MMKNEQFEKIIEKIHSLKKFDGGFYQNKFKGYDTPESLEDFEKLPFTEKFDLREAYPLGISAVPENEIVRIHSSSGTTGTPIIIPYTKQDVEDWAIMFERCYLFAGLTNLDRVHITPGYGLWTAGIGFQAGAERLGCMAIPMGPGMTEKQLQIMTDLKSTVLCSTSSHALLLAEEIEKRGIKDKIHLKKGVIGSERWSEKMRERINSILGIELYDIYGLTEIYGPGIGISCSHSNHIHYWDDYVYFEIIDPKTGEVLPEGELGELVITTFRKEGAPLIRYRTHDLTRIIPGECGCKSHFPRIDSIAGRTDDMVKVRGVNIYPGQIDDILKEVPGAGGEYRVIIEKDCGKDKFSFSFEVFDDIDKLTAQEQVIADFKSKVNLTVEALAVNLGELPRSDRKSQRIFDNRY